MKACHYAGQKNVLQELQESQNSLKKFSHLFKNYITSLKNLEGICNQFSREIPIFYKNDQTLQKLSSKLSEFFSSAESIYSTLIASLSPISFPLGDMNSSIEDIKALSNQRNLSQKKVVHYKEKLQKLNQKCIGTNGMGSIMISSKDTLNKHERNRKKLIKAEEDLERTTKLRDNQIQMIKTAKKDMVNPFFSALVRILLESSRLMSKILEHVQDLEEEYSLADKYEMLKNPLKARNFDTGSENESNCGLPSFPIIRRKSLEIKPDGAIRISKNPNDKSFPFEFLNPNSLYLPSNQTLFNFRDFNVSSSASENKLQVDMSYKSYESEDDREFITCSKCPENLGTDKPSDTTNTDLLGLYLTPGRPLTSQAESNITVNHAGMVSKKPEIDLMSSDLQFRTPIDLI